jgi:hypothetical protein
MNKQIEAIKRQVGDLVRDMHARKLAIPAGALLLAIVAAVFMLPKAATPPPAPTTAVAPAEKPAFEPVAQVTLIKPSSLDDDIALTSSTDPFSGTTGYHCTQVSSSPKILECDLSSIKVRVLCVGDSAPPVCAETGASGSTGSAGGGGASSGTGGGSTGGTGGDGTVPADGKIHYYTVVASIKIDLHTYKNVQVGQELPPSAPLAVLAGATLDRTQATFLAAKGVTVSGVDVDPSFGAFILKVHKSATLTDLNGVAHKITLSSLKQIEITP